MDFITHSLIGAGAARLIAPRREWLPQLTLAAVLASNLMDGDSWLYLIHPSYYGKYHRVASHCVVGLALTALVAAGVAWGACRVVPWRRFGWFVCPNLPKGTELLRPRFGWFLAVALPCAALHFAGDVITGFGNVLPFWPWSRHDASLHAVTSFDPAIFGATLAWHIAVRRLDLPRRREALAAAGYAVLVTAYVMIRIAVGPPSVW
ncbi:metal-dependent hydrolase [Candidatus Poribacteria bacterium]|nr:metal-dependent hydrolase [Candidatus Poribacteria bacterium]